MAGAGGDPTVVGGAGGMVGAGGMAGAGGAGDVVNPVACPATAPTDQLACTVSLDDGLSCSYAVRNCVISNTPAPNDCHWVCTNN